jgi:hypothetical protein
VPVPAWRPPLPHRYRECAHSHNYTGTGLAPPTFAAGMGSPLPHLH